jgi:hypothetical protein
MTVGRKHAIAVYLILLFEQFPGRNAYHTRDGPLGVISIRHGFLRDADSIAFLGRLERVRNRRFSAPVPIDRRS